MPTTRTEGRKFSKKCTCEDITPFDPHCAVHGYLDTSDRPTQSVKAVIASFKAPQGTMEFIECDTCRAKPGMPILCKGCLHNRGAIEDLHSELDRQRREIAGMVRDLDSKYSLCKDPKCENRKECDTANHYIKTFKEQISDLATRIEVLSKK